MRISAKDERPVASMFRERVTRRLGIRVEDAASGARLHHHHRHAVRDDVVEVTRDSRPHRGHLEPGFVGRYCVCRFHPAQQLGQVRTMVPYRLAAEERGHRHEAPAIEPDSDEAYHDRDRPGDCNALLMFVGGAAAT